MADLPVTDDHNVVLYDDQGNKIGTVLKNGIYRLENRGIITSPDGTKDVTVTTDGSKERLDVSLGADNEFQLQAFTPVVTFDSAGVALTTSWSTLLDYSATGGKLDFIACSVGSSNYKVRLTIDGVEIFDIKMSDLNTIGLTNAVNVNIWAETALKNFRYRPLISVDFNTSLKIEAAMTTGTGTLFYLINYRIEA